jgi:hypothetical protein
MQKVEFEFTLDDDGKPCISFKHHDKSNLLEQKLLKIFIDAAKEKGIFLNKTGGLASTNGVSWDSYEIIINK